MRKLGFLITFLVFPLASILLVLLFPVKSWKFMTFVKITEATIILRDILLELEEAITLFKRKNPDHKLLSRTKILRFKNSRFTHLNHKCSSKFLVPSFPRPSFASPLEKSHIARWMSATGLSTIQIKLWKAQTHPGSSVIFSCFVSAGFILYVSVSVAQNLKMLNEPDKLAAYRSPLVALCGKKWEVLLHDLKLNP